MRRLAERAIAMSSGTRGNPGKAVRAPHSATVARPNAPHPATVAQPRRSFGATLQRPPHPATIARPKASYPSRAVQRQCIADRTVVQRMDALRSYFQSDAFNPLARSRYTSCLCLVVTGKDEAHIEQAVSLSGIGFIDAFIGRGILSGMQEQWERAGPGRPFVVCSINTDVQTTPGFQYQTLCERVHKGDLMLGQWPLIVVVGHTAPGGQSIEFVEHGQWYACDDVAQKLMSFVLIAKPKCFTVFVSSCFSGLAGQRGQPSFQQSLDATLSQYWDGLFFSIGTASGSAPLPFVGRVHAQEFTFHRTNGQATENQSAQREQSDYQSVSLD